MKKLSARYIVSALVIICTIAIVLGTLWLGTREMSVEAAYNVAISALVVIISGVCVATMLFVGKKKKK